MKKIIFVLFAILCICIGVYPLIYFLIDRTFGLLSSKSDELLNDMFWNIGFYSHVLLGGLALLVGWIQFSKKLRLKNIKLHRIIGKIYVISVLISGLGSIYIAFFATGGLISVVGFLCLGLIWIYTTLLAYTSIRKGNLNQHQKFMILSYAACFAAVTLRIWLPMLTILLQDFISAYRIVAWLCWVPNILVGTFIIRKLGLNNS
ncbi:DUF2306 domain-containing protein [Hyunsoonleella sp. 2307UL5-6]|uniref:DUF2306 domain-containing protein n=1 Tax=Hyunsoonleella sp. 2307UL5-6 TaxID=3384768 RepID=UPI0039BC2E21